MPDSDSRKSLADILSGFAFLVEENDILTYILRGSQDKISSWGEDYISNLAGEVSANFDQVPPEFQLRIEDISRQLVAFYMKHDDENKAADLMLEVGCAQDYFVEHVREEKYKLICLYLIDRAKNLPEPAALATAYLIYLKFKQYPSALRIALRLDSMEFVRTVVDSCDDVMSRKQICFIIARHGKPFYLAGMEFVDEEIHNGYLELAHDMGLMEPAEIHESDGMVGAGALIDAASSTEILAGTYVNAFINAGFCKDKLMTLTSESRGENLQFSAVASLGLMYLWDVDNGMSQLERFYHSTDPPTLDGALLGIGILNCNSKKEHGALDFLVPYCTKDSVKVGAIIGLGMAYVGQEDAMVREELSSILLDSKTSLDVKAFAAISLGLVHIGSCDLEVATSINSALNNLNNSELGDPMAQLMILGMGLTYLGKMDGYEELYIYPDQNRKFSDVTLQACGYAGLGNVREFIDEWDCCLMSDTYEGAAAVLGIAMVAMGNVSDEDLALVSLENMLKSDKPNLRRAVPLALALLFISNPKINVMETLDRLSQDFDADVRMSSILALGLIGAGTKDQTIDRVLHNLSISCDKTALFCVRIAQGLLNLGNGLLTLSPHHSQRFLTSPVGLSGLVIFVHACLHKRIFILGKYDFVIFFLVLAMQPSMMFQSQPCLRELYLQM